MQFLRPAAQLGTNGQWQDQAGGTTAMHLAVDEAVLNSSDYAQAFGSGVGGDTLEYYVDFQLGSAQSPASTSGLAIRWNGFNFGIGDLRSVQLRRISTSVVVREEFTGMTTTPMLYTITLTPTEAAILAGGYDIGGGLSDFGLRFTRIGNEGTGNGARIEQAYFEIPDPGFPHLDIAGAGFIVAAVASGHYLEVSGSGLIRRAGGEGIGSVTGVSGSGLLVKI